MSRRGSSVRRRGHCQCHSERVIRGCAIPREGHARRHACGDGVRATDFKQMVGVVRQLAREATLLILVFHGIH